MTRSWCRPDHARNRRIGSLLNAGLVGAALLGLVTGRGHSDVLTPLDRDAEATRVTQRRGITRARRSSEDPVRIHGQDLAVDRSRLVKTVSIKEEWYQDVDDPEAFVEALKVSRLNADLFTFWQRPTDPRPKYAYYREPDAVAVIPIKGYRYWLEHQLNKRTRQAIRKAQRRGVDVRTVTFDDQLVGEITAIYNETPIRQGKRFPHYGKGFEAVKKINESYQERSEFLGAYYKDELIGFMKLTYMENYVDTMQLLSKIAHRDKSPSNALLAKAVERCVANGMPYLFYGDWSRGGLGVFKRHNGFQRLDLPRYYIPLTLKGRIALRSGLHRRVVRFLPERLVEVLIKLRTRWYARLAAPSEE